MKKVVVITGGAQGIGKIAALKLLENGWKVAVIDIDKEAIDEIKFEAASNNLMCIHANIADGENIQASIQQVIDVFGKVDAVINNAAISCNKPISELSLEEWNRVITINITAPFLFVKYAESELRKNRGVVINICSTRALQSEANTEAYSASKGGLLSFTHALAVSLGPDVRVNSISPGWIDVSTVKKKSKAKQEQLREEDQLQHPAGRVGEAKDVANMIMFLLNEENSFITGHNFIIDGGMTKKMIYV